MKVESIKKQIEIYKDKIVILEERVCITFEEDGSKYFDKGQVIDILI